MPQDDATASASPLGVESSCGQSGRAALPAPKLDWQAAPTPPGGVRLLPGLARGRPVHEPFPQNLLTLYGGR